MTARTPKPPSDADSLAGPSRAIAEEAAARDAAALGVPVHPVAALFPLVMGEDLDRMVEDMRRHGVLRPVTFDQHGRLLDGRNRLLAAKAAGRLHDMPEPERLDVSDDEAVARIFSLNDHRRHMTAGARAMAFALSHPATQYGGRRQKGAVSKIETAGLPPSRVSNARWVVRHNLELARDVLAGRLSVEAARMQIAASMREAERREIARRSEAWEANQRAKAEQRAQAEATRENVRFIVPKASTPTPQPLGVASPLRGVETTRHVIRMAPPHPDTFNGPERARLEQAIAAHKRQIDREFDGRVEAEVERRVAAEVERVRAEVGIQFSMMETRAKAAEADVKALRGRIPHSIYRLLLGAMKPERFDSDDSKAKAAEAFMYLKAHQAALAMTPGEEAEGVARVKRDQAMIERMRQHRAAEAERKAERERKAAERKAAKALVAAATPRHDEGPREPLPVILAPSTAPLESSSEVEQERFSR